MYRLKIDDLTHKILGYETVNEYLQTYKGDILVGEASLSDLGCYYESGEIKKEEREDYHAELGQLQAALRIQEGSLAEERDQVIQAILEGDLEKTRADIRKSKEEMAEIKKKIQGLEEKHKKDLEEFYDRQNREIDRALSPEYYSAVCLLVKDEEEYLQEWIEHYCGLGFDHIYIYDNGSQHPVADAVSLLPQETRGILTIVDFSGQYQDLQSDCYNHFLENYGKKTRWVAFVDSDEFIRITDPRAAKVNDFLKARERFTLVAIDFIEYGADGQEGYQDKPLKERFRTPVTVNDGIYYKDFIQPNRIERMQTHYAVFDPDQHPAMGRDKNAAVIDHYYTKSWEEWLKKMDRGSCDPKYLKRQNEFFVYNPDMAYLKTGEDRVQEYQSLKTDKEE